MSLPVKVGIALVTAGTVGGVGYGIFAYSQNKGTEISKLIEEEFQYKLLDTKAGETNSAQVKWKEIWKEYKEKSQNAFNLKGWKNDNTDFDLTETLKEKCKELSTTKIINREDNAYVNVTKYCARGVTFEEQAGKDKLTILDTSGSNHGTIWTSRFNAKTTTETHLNRLDIKSPVSEEAIRTGCNTAKAKNKQIENYENVYESYKLICTKQEGEKTE